MPTTPNPEFRQEYANLPSSKLMFGTIITDSTTPTVKRGKGFTVSKNGTGGYRITLNRNPGRIVCAVGTLRKAAGTATFLTGTQLNTATPNIIDFRTENASGTAANAGNTDEIDFIIVVLRDRLPV